MQAVIVAAGRGTRLGSLGKHTPKCLLKIGAVSLLERQLQALQDAGITRITVVVGHLAARISASLVGLDWRLQVRLAANPQYAATGGGASFLLGAEKVDDDLLYLIGDMLYDPDLIRRLAQPRNLLTLGVQFRPTSPEDMKVRVEGPLVVEVGKRIAPELAQGEFVGAAYLPRQMLAEVREGFQRILRAPEKSAYHFGDAIREMLADGVKIGWVNLADLFWCEIDCVRDLCRARRAWQERDRSEGRIAVLPAGLTDADLCSEEAAF